MTILDIRHNSGMTQAGFAQKFGFNVHTLQKWEDGEVDTPNYILKMVEDVIMSEQANNVVRMRSEDFPRQRERSFEDLTGRKFNMLTVVERVDDYVDPKGQRIIQWKCKCDCGNNIVKRGSALKSGKAVSCGCSRILANRGKGLIDLTGRQFGNLTVIRRVEDHIDPYGKKVPMWLCRCSCGNEVSVAGSALRNGRTGSCGCSRLKPVVLTNSDLSAASRSLQPTKPCRFTGLCGNFSKFTKYYQFEVFYKRELEMWEQNNIYRGVPFRDYLFDNRLKYIGKTPDQLSDAEILRGFRISGVYKGFTTYDATLMHDIIKEYKIESVYDPCAGWGERMLCCYSLNIPYTGIDINSSLNDGYKRMIKDLGITEQNFIVGDSSKIKAKSGYDAVVTCPPYWNIEIYSNNGAENFTYHNFLDWWKQVVDNSITDTVRYFCFQVNQKFKDDMSSIVESFGFKLIDSKVYKSNKSSHFTRKNGVNSKKEFETMLVFVR